MNYKEASNFVVSVRLMTFNHASFIEDALAGINIQQTNFPIEVVIGDDFSIDGTLQKIHDYKFSNPNITLKVLNRRVGGEYYKFRKKKGRLFNFVDILNNCSGKYIALLDGDDFWVNCFKLQKQIDFLEANKNYGICYHDVLIFEERERKLTVDYIGREIKNDSTILDLATDNFMHTPSVVLRNNFKIPDWFYKSFLGDRSFYMIQLRDLKIKKINGIMAVYRIHGSNIWSSKVKYERNKKTLEDLEVLYKYGQFDERVNAILQGRIRSYSQRITTAYKIKNKIEKFLSSFFRK